MWKSISVIILMNGLKIQWVRGNASTNNSYTCKLPISFLSRTSYACVCASNDERGINVAYENMDCYCVSSDTVRINRANFACTDWTIITIGY